MPKPRHYVAAVNPSLIYSTDPEVKNSGYGMYPVVAFGRNIDLGESPVKEDVPNVMPPEITARFDRLMATTAHLKPDYDTTQPHKDYLAYAIVLVGKNFSKEVLIPIGTTRGPVPTLENLGAKTNEEACKIIDDIYAMPNSKREAYMKEHNIEIAPSEWDRFLSSQGINASMREQSCLCDGAIEPYFRNGDERSSHEAQANELLRKETERLNQIGEARQGKIAARGVYHKSALSKMAGEMTGESFSHELLDLSPYGGTLDLRVEVSPKKIEAAKQYITKRVPKVSDRTGENSEDRWQRMVRKQGRVLPVDDIPSPLL